MPLTILATALLSASGAEGSNAVELRPKAVRTWTIDLPADPFQPVSGLIPIPHAGGEGFRVEAQGVGLAIDTDGDGELDRTVEGREHPETKVLHARVTLEGKGSDGEPFRYPVRLESKGAGWAWASSGVLLGEVAGQRVRFVDMNGNGSFADVGRDAVTVGGDVAQFLGESLLVDGDLHALKLAGSTLQLSPWAGDTGALDLRDEFDAEGVLLAAVVKSIDGKHSFELSGFEESVTIPAGRYRLVKAELGLGDSRVIADTRRMRAIRVRSGSTASIEWGAPLKASFEIGSKDGSLMLDPSKVRYRGAGGEVWTGWNPIGKSPTFKVKDRVTGDVLVDVVFPGSC